MSGLARGFSREFGVSQTSFANFRLLLRQSVRRGLRASSISIRELREIARVRSDDRIFERSSCTRPCKYRSNERVYAVIAWSFWAQSNFPGYFRGKSQHAVSSAKAAKNLSPRVSRNWCCDTALSLVPHLVPILIMRFRSLYFENNVYWKGK